MQCVSACVCGCGYDYVSLSTHMYGMWEYDKKKRKVWLWLLSCFVNALFISFHKQHLEAFQAILAPPTATKTNHTQSHELFFFFVFFYFLSLLMRFIDTKKHYWSCCYHGFIQALLQELVMFSHLELNLMLLTLQFGKYSWSSWMFLFPHSFVKATKAVFQLFVCLFVFKSLPKTEAAGLCCCCTQANALKIGLAIFFQC